jgi:hypothetical protein
VKRYLVFSGDNYYPSGGGDDFKFAYDDLEEAKKKAEELHTPTHKWAHVFDCVRCAVIYEKTHEGWRSA